MTEINYPSCSESRLSLAKFLNHRILVLVHVNNLFTRNLERCGISTMHSLQHNVTFTSETYRTEIIQDGYYVLVNVVDMILHSSRITHRLLKNVFIYHRVKLRMSLIERRKKYTPATETCVTFK